MPANVAPNEIEAAVAALRRGDVIGLPTETVYGLAADASNAAAVRRIFALKGRPADHPLIVHIDGAGALDRFARDVPDAARTLAARFWPGPLTLILERAPGVLDLVTGGQDTVGLRVPSHPVALAVLRAFGRLQDGAGLAAPSANRFGHVSPTLAIHVVEEFGADVPIVLDGGPCDVGIESTIVDLSGATPRVLRPGRIDVDALRAAIGPVDVGAHVASPRVSGSLASHYAPRTKAELVERDAIAAHVRLLTHAGERALVLARGHLPEAVDGLALPADVDGYAHHLYAALRQLDADDADRILIEAPPATPEWAAVRDRLTRAATPAEPDGS